MKKFSEWSDKAQNVFGITVLMIAVGCLIVLAKVIESL